MSAYSIIQNRRATCRKCGEVTEHRKRAPNYATHILTAFLTFLLWTPFILLAALLNAFRPYRCVACGSAARRRDLLREVPEGNNP